MLLMVTRLLSEGIMCRLIMCGVLHPLSHMPNVVHMDNNMLHLSHCRNIVMSVICALY